MCNPRIVEETSHYTNKTVNWNQNQCSWDTHEKFRTRSMVVGWGGGGTKNQATLAWAKMATEVGYGIVFSLKYLRALRVLHDYHERKKKE